MGVRDLIGYILERLIDFLEFTGIIWIYLILGYIFLIVIPIAVMVGLGYLVDFIIKHLGG